MRYWVVFALVAACGSHGPVSGDDDSVPDATILDEHQAPPFTITDPTDADLDGIADQLEDYLISQFAPEIRLPPDDIDWTRPANVDWYLPKVHMRFDHPNCTDHQILALGTIDFKNISQQTHPTTSGVGPLCSHTQTIVPSGPDTKYTTHTDFFLQPEDDNLVHPGIPPSQMEQWRVYAHVQPSGFVRDSDKVAAEYDIQIWFFYAYNDAIGPINHEADWEHVTISVSKDLNFVSAYYATHDAGDRWNASDILWRDRTHPVGYSADGSHATYRSAGEHPGPVVNDHCYDGGPIWLTWMNATNLGERGHVLNSQTWADYDGRWGEVGQAEFTSGPPGPMFHGTWTGEY